LPGSMKRNAGRRTRLPTYKPMSFSILLITDK
jgi:hypothetical protein